VTVVFVMNVTIVEIVDMVTVRHGSMATLGPVNVRMIGVNVTWHRALSSRGCLSSPIPVHVYGLVNRWYLYG
jgi:hypothetical protein